VAPAQHRRSRPERVRADLAARLSERRGEIEQAVLTRVHAVSDSGEVDDPSYAEGLRAAIVAAVDYGLAAVELGEERSPPPPPILLAQARLAARNDIGLDTVLRRYFAGHALLGDFLIEEAKRGDFRARDLQCLLRTQATLFDRLVAAVGEEHRREDRCRPSSIEAGRAERVRRLLAGELLDTSGLSYEFECFHLGVAAVGPRASETVHELATSLDRRLLAIDHGEGTTCAWLGGRYGVDDDELRAHLSAIPSDGGFLAFGQPARNLVGWRLTYHQARAALSVAMRSGDKVVHYADVVLLAAILQDNLLAASLRQLFLQPLERGRDNGEAARNTLRAYFAAGGNVTAAAAALKVNRNTLTRRLRGIEAMIDRPLDSCTAEIEIALQLAELHRPPPDRVVWHPAPSSIKG